MQPPLPSEMQLAVAGLPGHAERCGAPQDPVRSVHGMNVVVVVQIVCIEQSTGADARRRLRPVESFLTVVPPNVAQ